VAKFLKEYSRTLHDEALKSANEKISEVSLHLVQFMKELKGFPEGCLSLSKQEKIGDMIYRIFFDHYDKIEGLFKGKPGNIGLFYNMNNKYFLMDAIRQLDLKTLYSNSFLKTMKDSLNKDVQIYIEVCWQKQATSCLSELQILYEKDGKLKSATISTIKKKIHRYEYCSG